VTGAPALGPRFRGDGTKFSEMAALFESEYPGRLLGGDEKSEIYSAIPRESDGNYLGNGRFAVSGAKAMSGRPST
jgi:hypothetical protein